MLQCFYLWSLVIFIWSFDVFVFQRILMSSARGQLKVCCNSFNPFFHNALFLYHLKPSEKVKIFWCFQRVEKACVGNEWVNDVARRNISFCKSSRQNIFSFSLLLIFLYIWIKLLSPHQFSKYICKSNSYMISS